MQKSVPISTQITQFYRFKLSTADKQYLKVISLRNWKQSGKYLNQDLWNASGSSAYSLKPHHNFSH